MKTQEFINVYLHKNCMVMKLYFSNQDIKEVREMTIYEDFWKCMQKQTSLDLEVGEQKVDIQLLKFIRFKFSVRNNSWSLL